MKLIFEDVDVVVDCRCHSSCIYNFNFTVFVYFLSNCLFFAIDILKNTILNNHLIQSIKFNLLVFSKLELSTTTKLFRFR